MSVANDRARVEHLCPGLTGHVGIQSSNNVIARTGIGTLVQHSHKSPFEHLQAPLGMLPVLDIEPPPLRYDVDIFSVRLRYIPMVYGEGKVRG